MLIRSPKNYHLTSVSMVLQPNKTLNNPTEAIYNPNPCIVASRAKSGMQRMSMAFAIRHESTRVYCVTRYNGGDTRKIFVSTVDESNSARMILVGCKPLSPRQML